MSVIPADVAEENTAFIPVSQRGQYKSKTVAAAVGISPTLLKAWERRYDFLQPGRHCGNYRLYSEEDLHLLKRIKLMLDSGLAIGEVAALGRENILGVPRLHPGSPQVDLQASFHPCPERCREEESTDIPAASLAELMALAPVELESRRAHRFAGESLGARLGALSAADIATTHRLYLIVKGLYEVWSYMEQRLVPEVVLGRLAQLRDPEFLSQIQVLGLASDTSDLLIRAALADSRQGALTRLLELCRTGSPEALVAGQLQMMVTLARDHAKMMRNAFFDLDSPLRQADEILKAHDLQPILKKVGSLLWSGRVQKVGSNYEGSMTCRCLEASTLDRVLYDFSRRLPCGPSFLWIARINEGMTRWAFESSQSEFRAFTNDDFSALAVGLAAGVSAHQALEQGYLGTTRRNGTTWSWFHWPTYQPPPQVPHCHCDPMVSASVDIHPLL